MRDELTKQGKDIDGKTKDECRLKLDDHLAGIKRPLALLCTDTMSELPRTHSRYSVAQLEILHDLKSIIGEVPISNTQSITHRPNLIWT